MATLHTCDAAGCKNSQPEPLTQIATLDLCPSCVSAVVTHLAILLRDPEAMAEVRSAGHLKDAEDAALAVKRDAIARESAIAKIASQTVTKLAAKAVKVDADKLRKAIADRIATGETLQQAAINTLVAALRAHRKLEDREAVTITAADVGTLEVPP